MNDFEKKLIDVASINDMTRDTISKEKATLFYKLFEHMILSNKNVNVTSITAEDDVILKHFIDSVVMIDFIKENARVCDIGCGGGFPSLPISILRNDVTILCDDSVTKKVEYVKNVADYLGLDNIEISNERAEDLGKNPTHRESFDVVCARGVGRLNIICELCLPLVKVGGIFIAMKSGLIDDELNESKEAIKKLGGEISIKKYTLTDGKETISRSLIIIEKKSNTPNEYPRNYSQITKRPLIG